MAHVELVADSDVVSYIYKREPRGQAFSDLIRGRPMGITLLSIAESRKGVVYANWGNRELARLHAFLSRFFVVEFNAEIANVCGGLLGRCKQIGISISWTDAWAAATALWLDVPLVAHDRDLQRVPGLRVLTIHADWQVREEGFGIPETAGLWLGEDRTTARTRAAVLLSKPQALGATPLPREGLHERARVHSSSPILWIRESMSCAHS